MGSVTKAVVDGSPAYFPPPEAAHVGPLIHFSCHRIPLVFVPIVLHKYLGAMQRQIGVETDTVEHRRIALVTSVLVNRYTFEVLGVSRHAVDEIG